MENQDRYEAIFRLALIHAKAVAKTTVGGDSAGMRAALSYVGMVASEYSQVIGKDIDIRYAISHGKQGARLHLHESAQIQRMAEPEDELPQKGSCRQLYEESPLFHLSHQESIQENTQEDGPCLQL